MRPILVLLAACAACGKELVVGDEARLVAYWRLDDGPGSARAVDSSGNGNHAFPESVSTTDWQTGHAGGALSFGQAGWLRTPFGAGLNTVRTALTVATWIRVAAVEARDQVIMQRQAGTGADVRWLLRLRGGRPSLESPATGACDAPAPLPVGQWVHLAATYDGAMIRLAYDGQEVRACAASGALDADATGVTVGAPQIGPGPFDVDKGRALRAVLDDVVLYARALSSAEVQALAAGQPPPLR